MLTVWCPPRQQAQSSAHDRSSAGKTVFPDYRRLLYESGWDLMLLLFCRRSEGKRDQTRPVTVHQRRWQMPWTPSTPTLFGNDGTHIPSQNCPGSCCVIKGHSFSFASPLWVERGERKVFPRFIPLPQTDGVRRELSALGSLLHSGISLLFSSVDCCEELLLVTAERRGTCPR